MGKWCCPRPDGMRVRRLLYSNAAPTGPNGFADVIAHFLRGTLWPVKDPDDQWIVAAATEGNADVLVSGDQDLLEIADKVQVRILSPRGFWEALR